MASTILYKFQSGTTFEALPLPGSAARLFDVKKAIVKAKKLDNTGSMEFDLGVRNADTNEEYANESMVLPRGTRLIVQRLPAARGHGFLARMARNEHAGVIPGPGQGGGPGPGGHYHQPVVPGSAPSGFYTIDSRARDDDEFVQSGDGPGGDDEKELAALQAATNMQSSGPAMTGGYSGGPARGPGAGGGPPRGGGGGGGAMGGPPKPAHFRPNADPELRDQEKQLMPKKRATGIPRTFLNLNAPPKTDANLEGEDANVPLLQPNTLGFKELVNRGGGQSENTAGTRRDLEYALKLTATSVPDHLQCGICNGVVKNAMLLPWDPEGRTACEICIRDALTQNGFRCPLTGMDGVSPDDLIPNVGLRKAADLFIQSVMDKVDEIEKQQVEEVETTIDTSKSTEANVLDGDGVEKGVIVSKKMTLANRRKDSDDPFGDGDDDFGGDVFAIASQKPKEEPDVQETTEKEVESKIVKQEPKTENNTSEPEVAKNTEKSSEVKESVVKEETKTSAKAAKDLSVSNHSRPDETAREPPKQEAEAPVQKRRERRRRGPPVGYSMGPAGARAAAPTGARSMPDNGHGGFQGDMGGTYPPPHRGGGDFRGGGNSAGFRGRGRGRFPGGRGDFERSSNDAHDDDSSRGTKRSFDDHMSDGHWDSHPPPRFDRHDGRGGRGPGHGPGDFGRDDRGGRGGYRNGGGGRGSFRGRGGNFRGGGRGYGRGRY